MADKITKAVSIGAEVDDQPGVLAEMTSMVASAGINLIATAGYTIGGGRARVEGVAEDPEKLRNLAAMHNVVVTETPVFLVEGEDRVGALVGLTSKLSGAGINIMACFAAATGGRYAACIAVRPADFERAAKVLGV
jgi:hypothetical protein